MTFLDHLEDLRWTIGRSVIAFFSACLLVGIFLH
ncbi:MAG: twin-arginine translocase subunit TatC, partial [Verrucomicrobia bacterium]|nr:twin-arginine translocase subunit TatC [Verrucomicrobiota bacterium]